MNRRARKAGPQGSVASTRTASEFAVEVLRNHFSRRFQKNPQYSQRAFARHLGVSHTLLSLIFAGRRSVSPQLVRKLTERLDLPSEQIALLLESAGKSKKARPAKGKRLKEASRFNKISLDQFALLSEWQHFAILSLLEVPGTRFEAAYVAKRLGISPTLAQISIQRLKDLGIVERDAVTGKWRQKPGPIVVENVESTAFTKQFQKQLMEKAIESLYQDPMAVRDMSSTTFAMDPKRVPFALKRIREFRRALVRELEAFGHAEEVYNLTVQIFPTSRKAEK